MVVGILKETNQDNRVILLPESVQALVQLNVEVLVEKQAGMNASVSDEAYTQAGANVKTKDEVIANADVICKIHEPDSDDLVKMKEGQVLFGLLQPFQNEELVEELITKNITAFSLELVPRITRAQAMDVLSSQATVAGYKAVLEAASKLNRFFPMFMSAAGTIKPAKLLILGAGVAGLQAVAIARKLGAVVEVFDVRSAVKEEVRSLGGKFIEVEGAAEDQDAGGYAVEQAGEYKQKQAQLIHDHAIQADVIICTAQIPGKRAPLLVNKETVEEMKKGAIIVDLAASSGGNCELSRNGESYNYNGIEIIGESNFPSLMPLDASRMLGKNLINFLQLIINKEGHLNLNFEDEIVQGTCLVHNKQIVNERVRNALNK
ncbi:MAG: Re/Si-specific NAD(P)(+) transhydrogenase subunit alpha [Bacteroidetes bacterium]|jgi:NAD(P) transhydrogenase subunit alpha|nr:Re/Si-specific NAD(P)(+) transhydrogenase subunit alpha [Bacteroidota bacterium]